jgi:hypothetical protein
MDMKNALAAVRAKPDQWLEIRRKHRPVMIGILRRIGERHGAAVTVEHASNPNDQLAVVHIRTVHDAKTSVRLYGHRAANMVNRFTMFWRLPTQYKHGLRFSPAMAALPRTTVPKSCRCHATVRADSFEELCYILDVVLTMATTGSLFARSHLPRSDYEQPVQPVDREPGL